MEDERGPSLLEAIKDFSENASPVDFVITFAIKVFPVPGGPCNKIPFGV